jgi:hypothetical protein
MRLAWTRQEEVIKIAINLVEIDQRGRIVLNSGSIPKAATPVGISASVATLAMLPNLSS